MKPSAETQGDRCKLATLRLCDFELTLSKLQQSVDRFSHLHKQDRDSSTYLIMANFVVHYIQQTGHKYIELARLIGFIPPIHRTWSPPTSDTDLSFRPALAIQNEVTRTNQTGVSPTFAVLTPLYEGNVNHLAGTSITTSDRTVARLSARRLEVHDWVHPSTGESLQRFNTMASL